MVDVKIQLYCSKWISMFCEISVWGTSAALVDHLRVCSSCGHLRHWRSRARRSMCHLGRHLTNIKRWIKKRTLIKCKCSTISTSCLVRFYSGEGRQALALFCTGWGRSGRLAPVALVTYLFCSTILAFFSHIPGLWQNPSLERQPKQGLI